MVKTRLKTAKDHNKLELNGAQRDHHHVQYSKSANVGLTTPGSQCVIFIHLIAFEEPKL